MAKSKNTPEKKPKTPRKIGRPTDYDQDIALKICSLISTSCMSIRSICKPKDMPVPSTIYVWINKHPEFKEQYARAKEDQATYMAEELIEINSRPTTNMVEVQKQRLESDNLKWLMSKILPKKFGDKLEVKSDNLNRNVNSNTTVSNEEAQSIIEKFKKEF